MVDKKPMTWRELIKTEIDSRRKAGKDISLTKILPEIKVIWADIKKGEHALYTTVTKDVDKVEKKVKQDAQKVLAVADKDLAATEKDVGAPRKDLATAERDLGVPKKDVEVFGKEVETPGKDAGEEEVRPQRKGIKPGHKRAPSKTRRGRLDYVTHKGSKYYNRRDKWQSENIQGVKGSPYVNAKTRKKKPRRKSRTLSKCRTCSKYKKEIKRLKGLLAKR